MHRSADRSKRCSTNADRSRGWRSVDGRFPVRSALGELVLYPDVPHAYDSLGTSTARRSAWVARWTAPAELLSAQGGRVGGDGFIPPQADRQERGDRALQGRCVRTGAPRRVRGALARGADAAQRPLFPTRYAGRNARFGAPFGSVLRGQQAGSPIDEARFEGAGSRWAVVGDDDGGGLGVITEAKYGWNCRDGVLGLSLLRAPTVTGEDSGHNRLFPAGIRAPRADGQARTAHTDQGVHMIRLALCCHGLSGGAVRNAAALAGHAFHRAGGLRRKGSFGGVRRTGKRGVTRPLLGKTRRRRTRLDFCACTRRWDSAARRGCG